VGVERVDYSSDDDYQQALEAEQREYEQMYDDDDVDIDYDPPVVPCYFCGEQCYENSNVPEENMCADCYARTQLERLLVLHKKLQEEKKHDEEKSKKDNTQID
jgi:hypothetical protein